ncbi:short chain dehydrogenase reductase [Xylaria telfairii]|nr:short chain dehydrogenase reductase [Xylaria telfairii]
MLTIKIEAHEVTTLRALELYNEIVAIITGIGLVAARIITSKGGTFPNINIKEPSANEKLNKLLNLYFHQCDFSIWADLRTAFDLIGPVDFVFANAAVTEKPPFFENSYDGAGQLQEPSHELLDVDINGVLYTGSITITTSVSGYARLIRPLRSILVSDDVAINGVAPAATMTGLLRRHLVAHIIAQGLPVSTSHFDGLKLVYAATASQNRRVDRALLRWNGRVILTLGDAYAEIEESTADLRRFWFGNENLRLTCPQ